MLGTVGGADVEIHGSSGLLASGTTDAGGAFGPITYSSSYTGPLRVFVVGNATASWICDQPLGCAFDSVVYDFGDELPFDGTIEAVVRASASGQSVHVNLLTTLVSRQVASIGPLTAANVDQANQTLSDLLVDVFGDVLVAVDVTLPEDLASLEVTNLNDLPADLDQDSEARTVLSLFNATLLLLTDGSESIDEFIDRLDSNLAADVELSISSALPWNPSRESLLRSFVLTAGTLFDSGAATANTLGDLLGGISLLEIAFDAFDAWSELPALVAEPGRRFPLRDS